MVRAPGSSDGWFRGLDDKKFYAGVGRGVLDLDLGDALLDGSIAHDAGCYACFCGGMGFVSCCVEVLQTKDLGADTGVDTNGMMEMRELEVVHDRHLNGLR